MSDELLPYYEQELAFIRHLGAEFAQAHPKVAARLRLGTAGTEDPHVERLIESFSLLSARIRHKLDDDFPELTDSLLSVLYPHYQAPIPSMAIVGFELDRSQGELTTGYVIPRNEPIEAQGPDGSPCQFRTCYPVTLWPIRVDQATFAGSFAAPPVSFPTPAAAALRLSLKCTSPGVTFAQLASDPGRMFCPRFYLHGQPQHVFALYEMLLNNSMGVALASSPRDTHPIVLGKECLTPVGFRASGNEAEDEGMLPYTPRSFPGYRLLSEFFTFPRKFLFVELAGLDARVLSGMGDTLDVYVFFDRVHEALELNIKADMFRLGCTPVVNLFRQTAEPIRITHTQYEYRVVPDARRPGDMEVYSIGEVTASPPGSQGGPEVTFQPFYSFRHAASELSNRAFWHSSRRPSGYREGKVLEGTELFISLVNLEFERWMAEDWTLHVDTICLDRNRPYRLWAEGQPVLRLVQGRPISKVECLVSPTRAFYPTLRRAALWKVISHLSLNHLSLADYEEGADALREILALYDYADSDSTHRMIGGIRSVRGRQAVGRVPNDVHGGFCRGVEVTVDFDLSQFLGSSPYLFAAVLERFLGLYCNVNSFTKFVGTTNEGKRELYRWPPRSGNMTLV